MFTCSLCGRTTCDCVERVRTSADLPEYIHQDVARYGGKITGRGNQYFAHCPFHNSKDRDLSIFMGRDGAWRFCCQGASCGKSGDVFTYVMERSGLTFQEALEQISGIRAMAQVPVRVRSEPICATKHPPLDKSIILAYHDALGPAEQATPERIWWHEQGINDASIDRFMLGYCWRCPTAYDPETPTWWSPSYTIPVYAQSDVLNVRHRLVSPLTPGDKYRPQVGGLGLQIFNADSLTLLPDGSPRPDRKRVLLVEGEKKVIVPCQIGMDWDMAIITLTGGAKSWLGVDGTPGEGKWWQELVDYDEVLVAFDPDAGLMAERTAKLFGRRGFVVDLPEKPDDLIMSYGDAGLRLFTKAIDEARPAVRSFWAGSLPKRAQVGIYA
jgi:hypothetical protein